MKLITGISFLIVIAVSILSCNGNVEQKHIKEKGESRTQVLIPSDGVHNVDLKKSTIVWTGHKVFGRNTGHINLSKGELDFKDGEIIGGDFVIDMKSIVTTDMIDEGESHEESDDDALGEHDDKTELAQHLKGDDYFDVLHFPIATFTVKDAHRENNEYKVSGDITIKGITKNISFLAELKAENQIYSLLKISRSDFGIEHDSQVLNSVVKDEFELMLLLSF